MPTAEVFVCGLVLISCTASAQSLDLSHAKTTDSKAAFVMRGDIAHAGLAAVGVALISLADEGVAKASQRAWLHDRALVRHSANCLQVAGDPGALLTSVSLYIIGTSAHRPGLADAGLHSTEAIAVGGVLTQLLKVGVGRARPNVSHDSNPYMFHPLHGRQTDFNSFPSGHANASFAAATVFTAEISRLHPRASRFATPALFSVATLVGTARIYNNRHWLSDVVTSALIGHFVGERITEHAHTNAMN